MDKTIFFSQTIYIFIYFFNVAVAVDILVSLHPADCSNKYHAYQGIKFIIIEKIHFKKMYIKILEH